MNGFGEDHILLIDVGTASRRAPRLAAGRRSRRCLRGGSHRDRRVGLHHEPMRARRIAQDARRAPDTWIPPPAPRVPVPLPARRQHVPATADVHARLHRGYTRHLRRTATIGRLRPDRAASRRARRDPMRRRDGRSVLVAPSAATTHGRAAPPGSNRGCHGDAQRMSCDRVTRGELEHRPSRRADANTQGIRLRCGAAPGYTPEDMHRAAASGIVP